MKTLITINVRTSVALSDILGHWHFNIRLPEQSRFKDLLNELKRAHGERLEPYLFEQDGKTPASHIMFMINGRNIRFMHRENTILQNGDQVTILLPAGGG